MEGAGGQDKAAFKGSIDDGKGRREPRTSFVHEIALRNRL
jgi:hypothetical protein